MPRCTITGFGTWVPNDIVRNDAWPPQFGQRAAETAALRTFNDIEPPRDAESARLLLEHLSREASDPFLGATQRHRADPTITDEYAEACAAQQAMHDADVGADDIDVVLTHSVVPDQVSISTSGAICKRLGIRNVLGFAVESACASGLAQLFVAKALIESGQARHVLLTQSHLMLRAVPFEHPATPGLGDAASAMVVSADRPGLEVVDVWGVTQGEYCKAVAWRRATLEPDSAEQPWWRASEHDFMLSTHDRAGVKTLMRDTVQLGYETVAEVCSRAGVELHELAALLSVQPRGFIPRAIAERLGLASERGVQTYDQVAHIGACGPVFNAVKARSLGLFVPDAWLAMYAQGAGFSRMAALLQVTT